MLQPVAAGCCKAQSLIKPNRAIIAPDRETHGLACPFGFHQDAFEDRRSDALSAVLRLNNDVDDVNDAFRVRKHKPTGRPVVEEDDPARGPGRVAMNVLTSNSVLDIQQMIAHRLRPVPHGKIFHDELDDKLPDERLVLGHLGSA